LRQCAPCAEAALRRATLRAALGRQDRTQFFGGMPVSTLLSLSRLIDRLNERIGQLFYWLILLMVLISAANAVVRKVFNYSSNGLLEIQWYLFSAIFLFLAGYTLLRNEHVRIDVIAGRLSKRAQTWIDILGTLFFLLPMASLVMWLSWPIFVDAFERHEVSTNAGGLIIWPARLLVPIGFALLVLQGISELIKRIAFLQGLIPDPSEKHVIRTAEEELAEDILRARGEKALAEEIVDQAREDRQ
jgi:TRAP-type mannitol/chloroaromatic compound transport system permease small subunit